MYLSLIIYYSIVGKVSSQSIQQFICYCCLEMYTISYRPSIPKILLATIILLAYSITIYIFIGIYFTHSNIITSLIIALTIIMIVRAVGLFVIYPGSYRFIASQVEITENENLLRSIHRDLRNVEAVAAYLVSLMNRNGQLMHQNGENRIYGQNDTSTSTNFMSALQKLYNPKTLPCIKSQLNVITKGENPNQNKYFLIQSYKKLIYYLTKQISLIESQIDNKGSQQEDSKNELKIQNQKQNRANQQSISIQRILQNPNLLHRLPKVSDNLKCHAQTVINLSRRIWQLCTAISHIYPKANQDYKFSQKQQKSVQDLHSQRVIININKFQMATWQMFGDRLFTLNSYYGYWDQVLEYQRLMVPVDHGDFIECVVIFGQKKNKKQKETKEHTLDSKIKQQINIGVLFCNPNGAFIQGFGLTSSYINFYVRWGLKVILWNYRGYGKSTGQASVPRCISDAQKVYAYISQKFKIKIQVLHGYSIGGIPSISLAHKLNTDYNGPIKLLIADRTFSSLDRVAQGFIKKRNIIGRAVREIAKPFVKLFFYSECVDNSVNFIQSKCNKLCIYDTRDQVISQSGSLRQGILSQALMHRQKIEDQVNSQTQRLIEQQFSNVKLKDQAQQFSENLYRLQKMNKTMYQRLLSIFQDLDGGGQYLRVKLPKISNQVSLTKQQIKQKSSRYFINMVIYGPKLCVPYNVNENTYESFIKNTFEKKIKLISQEQKNATILQKQLIQKIIVNFQYVKSQLKLSQIKKSKKKYGQILITSIGHNSEFKRQYYFLEKALHEFVLKQHKEQPMNINKIEPMQQELSQIGMQN